MLDPTRFQVRQSTVLVMVVLVMGSMFYQITGTKSAGRQDTARTQDISLPAAQPVEHKIGPPARLDCVGRSSSFSAASTMMSSEGDVAFAVGTTGTAGTSVCGDASGQSWSDTPGTSGNAPGHVGSTSRTGRAGQ